jgi:SAM-dependent methyltransferase
LATWYNGWVGEGGSEYHRELAVPAVMRLLDPRAGEAILDVGCGQGVLAPFVSRAGAQYVGVDASPRLLELARKTHGRDGKYLLGDARQLPGMRELQQSSYDGVVFLLSLQDMDPLETVVAGAAWAVCPGGRVVLLLTHPSFRVPRQSGWGWDEGRKLVYRRVDRYLTPLPVPMNSPGGKATGTVTRSFHRPISAYVNALAYHGLWVDRMEELPAHKLSTSTGSRHAEELARKEIPLFLAVRARLAESE